MVPKHFGLNRMPFMPAPDKSLLVNVPTFKEVTERMERTINSGSGIAVVVGQAGCGKSLMLEYFKDKFEDQFGTVSLVCPRIKSRTELLQNILFQLDQPYRNQTEGELRLSLFDFLDHPEQCPNGILLLVDEAHLLPIQLLEELRLMTNVVRNGLPRIRLALIGGYPLEERLNHPKLAAFTQRITCRCYLNPLTRDETHLYVMSQFQICGREGREICDQDAIDALHDISQGVPRVINQVCYHVMEEASRTGESKISSQQVQKAWSELQCIPWQEPDSSLIENSDTDSVVEFGSLSSEPIEPQPAAEEVIESNSEQRTTYEMVDQTPTADDSTIHISSISGFDAGTLASGNIHDESDSESTSCHRADESEDQQPTKNDEEQCSQSSDLDKPRPAESEPVHFGAFTDNLEVSSQNEIESLVTELAAMDTTLAEDEVATIEFETNEDPGEHKINMETADIETESTPGSDPADVGIVADIDPFHETFSEEESVSDEYSELITRSNKQSLEVQSEELCVLESEFQNEIPDISSIQFVESESTDLPSISMETEHQDCELRDDSESVDNAPPPLSEIDSDIVAPSISMEHPIVDDPSYQGEEIKVPECESDTCHNDDRDMIMVSRIENQPSPEPQETIPLNDKELQDPPSQGTAIRVDLKDLFTQLRSFENES